MNQWIWAACASLALAAGSASAETTGKAGSHDKRVTYATFQEGQVYFVPVQVGVVTVIEVGAGERVLSVVAGDTEAFKVDRLERPNIVVVKPVVAGAGTNLTIETNQRIYFLSLRETTKQTPFFSLKFSAPVLRSASATAAESEAIPPTRPMTYKLSRDASKKAFAPVSITDDGRKTYFRIPPGAPIPSVFRADAQGREYTVNKSTKGTLITVPLISERWVLRVGTEYVCITGKEGK